ncbi:MAG: 2-amino-4-oxopentanoate thiolase subunit OrtA [Bacillota bacterium]
MFKAKKGDWVQIHQIVLDASQRAPHLPEDTKQVPLELWVKGVLLQDAGEGDEVEIETLTGRKVRGRLVQVNPGYTHDYGSFVEELQKVGPKLRAILYGGEK